MEQKARIVLIPVVYNNPEECARYLASVVQADLSRVSLTVIIADNSREDNRSFFSGIYHENLRLIYYYTGTNLGYMNAGYAAYGRYVQNKIAFDILVVSNTDLVIEDRNFFNHLAEKDRSCSEDVFLLAPYVESSLTGRNLNPQLIRKPKKNYVDRIRFFYSSPILYNALLFMSWLKHKYMSVSHTYESDLQIYAPHGSIFIFRNAFFERGCNIHFPYFLFGEEIYIAEQVKEKKGKILYVPELNVIHNEHTSTGLFKWGRKFDAIRQTRENMKSLYHY